MTRIYIVTGSASGIGAEATRQLRAQGHTVIGIDLTDAEVVADLSTPEGRRGAAARAVEQADGTVDAVIACAGIATMIPKAVSVNYFGVVELLQELRPALARSQAPRVAVISSLAAVHASSPELIDACLAGDEAKALEIAESFMGEDPLSGYAVYPGSKRALARWVRRESITPEWAGAGIALNAVGPGTVVTPMTAELLATDEATELVDAAVPMPLNYHQPPASVAALLLWLCSPENTHTTGQMIFCDGGAEATLRGEDVFSWND